jgi:two-component system LytT family response regulator
LNTTLSLKKLRCVIVDDDTLSAEILKDQCHDSIYVEHIRAFYSPKKFLLEEHTLAYDVCLLDINMPELNGFDVAGKLKHKLVIFVSGFFDNLKPALDMIGPIDVLPKPVRKERLDKALEKALLYISHNKLKKDFELFNIAESNGKLKVKMTDIIYVKAAKKDRRNKEITLKSGDKYTLMNCTFSRILESSPHLLQVNKSEVISLELIHKIDHDTISLKKAYIHFNVKHVTLSRAYKKDLPNSAFIV